MQRQLQAKPKLIHAPPRTESEAVAALERQLKAAQTRIKNLTAKASTAWAAAKANPATISKAKLRKLQKALHPDGESAAGAARKAQLTEAAQILNAIKFQMRDD